MPIPPAPRLPQPVPLQEGPLWAMPVAQGCQPAVPRRPPSPETLDPNLPAMAGDNPTAYHHPACGGSTTFPPDVAARISGDPFGFIPATYCAACRRYVGLRSVVWQGTRETLAAYRGRLRRQMHPGKILLRVLGGPLIGALLGVAIGFLANPDARWLGVLEGVAIGLPLGYFVTGIVFQVAWSMARKKASGAA